MKLLLKSLHIESLDIHFRLKICKGVVHTFCQNFDPINYPQGNVSSHF